MQHLRFYCTRPLSLHHFRLNTTLFWKIFSPLSRAQTTWNCIPSYSIFPACEAGYAVNRRKRKPRIRLPSAAFLSPGRPESSPAAQPVSKQLLPIQRVFPDSYHMAGWSKMDETCRMNECPYRFTLSPFRDCRSSDPLSAVPCLFKNLQSDILHPTGHRNRKSTPVRRDSALSRYRRIPFHLRLLSHLQVFPVIPEPEIICASEKGALSWTCPCF